MPNNGIEFLWILALEIDILL